jgi:hypothetical protein
MVRRTVSSVPQRRQPRLGERRVIGSQVTNPAPRAGSWTPRTRRPADGLPMARESRHSTRGSAGAGRGGSGASSASNVSRTAMSDTRQGEPRIFSRP